MRLAGFFTSAPMTTKHDTLSSGVQAIPAVTLVGTQVFGLHLNEWAALFGIGFIVIQAAYLLWKWRREAERKANEGEST